MIVVSRSILNGSGSCIVVKEPFTDQPIPGNRIITNLSDDWCKLRRIIKNRGNIFVGMIGWERGSSPPLMGEITFHFLLLRQSELAGKDHDFTHISAKVIARVGGITTNFEIGQGSPDFG